MLSFHSKQRFSFFVILMIITFLIIVYNNSVVNVIYNLSVKKTNWIDELYNKYNFTGKTYALIFYGRKAQATILLRYLEKNLKVNGGILDKIVFSVRTDNKKDLEYLDSILKQNKSYFEKRVFPAYYDFKELYDELPHEDLIFKIDDDIVFIAPNTFENMLKEYLINNLIVLSANVINHSFLSHVHARMMAPIPFYENKDNRTWTKDEDSNTLDRSECGFGDYGPFSRWWSNGKCAAIVHESFFVNARNNKLGNYNFLKWDFHQGGYERWSINFILFKGKYVNQLKSRFPSIEDEVAISREIPKIYDRHSYSLGSALVVHFSYFSQNDYLKNTMLLQKYYEFSTEFLKIYT
jgi:hypothetical protein